MTEHADWPHDVDPMPSMEPSSDLFDGDILGDELIDIYNAAVVGGSDENDDDMNELPSLLAPTPAASQKDNRAFTPPMTHSTPVPGVSDDGLGAFRPSTSFNDLTTLLPPTPAEVAPKHQQVTAVAPPDSAPPTAAASVQIPESRKRAAEVSAAGAAKRRLSTSKKPQVATAPKTKAVKSAPSSSKSGSGSSKKNTPNPLNITSSAVAHLKATGKTSGTKPVIKAPVASSSGAAVVSPRVPSKASSSSVDSAATAPAPTEADFKSVAQAAVSNLIMNAGSKSETSKKGTADVDGEKIDTSTEHIKALTGSNWVSVCAGGDENEGANAAADKMNNRARRQNLTADERARQNRDRNREHARNTRLRKKAYVEELKRTLTALVTQRDATELEKRHTAQRELEQREVRFRVVEEFLKLRGRNEVNFARWAAILEEDFSLSLPLTDFRETSSERRQFEQVITGVSQAMTDSNLFSSFLQTLGKGANGSRAVSFAYDCDRKNFFMDNCTAVLDWTASSQGAVEQGAPLELVLKGNLKAHFSAASNKLISVSMSFDTGIIMSQLTHIFKSPGTMHDEVDAATAAAQVAASEADAILDSLQMPHIPSTTVPTNVVTVAPPNAHVAVTDGEKSDSSDESNGDSEEAAKAMSMSRAIRAST